MAYYQSNYPSNYGSYGGYGGGPPPPPGGYGGGPAYPGGYGGGYQTSAYNVNSPYQMGSVPPPGGQYGYQSGAVPGFTVPAVQNCSNMYQGHQQVAPPQMPSSYSSHGYSQQSAQMNCQMQEMMRAQAQAMIEHEMGITRRGRKKNKKKKKRRQRRDEEEDEDEDEEEDDEEEEEEEEEEKPQVSEEEIKKRLKKIYVGEQCRRINVSGTLEMTDGTVHRFQKYTDDDPVVAHCKKKDMYVKDKDWDPELDCEYLKDAIEGLGTNEEAIICCASSRNNEQRQILKKQYKTSYGKDLVKDLAGDTSFNFKTALMALFVPPAEYDAWCIKEAIYGLGTDERALIEIFMTRTNPQIQEIRNCYNKVVNEHRNKGECLIEDDIEGDTSGDFKRLLISACQGNRKHITPKEIEDAVEEIEIDGQKTGMYEVNFNKLCDMERAKRDAQALYKAGEDKWGTDEATFIRIFACRDYYQLLATYKEYVKLCQRDIENSIDRETSGNFKKGLCAIATCVKNRPKFFAKELKLAMKGLGTADNRLIRIIVSRSEIDMQQIKKEFLEENKQTLWNWIDQDCSGDYKKLLQAIVGKN